MMLWLKESIPPDQLECLTDKRNKQQIHRSNEGIGQRNLPERTQHTAAQQQNTRGTVNLHFAKFKYLL